MDRGKRVILYLYGCMLGFDKGFKNGKKILEGYNGVDRISEK
jgi:hypothetical protein